MSKADAAAYDFSQGCSCSQAVFAQFAESPGMDRATALRVSAGFGGGIGRMGLTCGAVTGAVMAIGLRHGAIEAQDREAKERTHRLVREFTARFRARQPSITCRELLGCDISTPEGYEKAHNGGLMKTVCPGLVRCAVEILEEMLPDRD